MGLPRQQRLEDSETLVEETIERLLEISAEIDGLQSELDRLTNSSGELVIDRRSLKWLIGQLDDWSDEVDGDAPDAQADLRFVAEYLHSQELRAPDLLTPITLNTHQSDACRMRLGWASNGLAQTPE